jgi:hypothetical protein
MARADAISLDPVWEDMVNVSDDNVVTTTRSASATATTTVKISLQRQSQSQLRPRAQKIVLTNVGTRRSYFIPTLSVHFALLSSCRRDAVGDNDASDVMEGMITNLGKSAVRP